ncbi:MAG: hypothetical protein J6S85_23345 [Methanobrevibacter sp.]|nr:hypothetical protein [Methanobrevibacter sp.]
MIITTKFYLKDLMKMSEEEIVKLFFEFLNHMDKLTDVIESMAKKMQEMDKRIEALERKQRRKNEDDED